MASAAIAPKRVWPVLDVALFGAAMALGVAALPLGLDRVGAAPWVAAGHGLSPQAGADAPLVSILVRLLAFLPLGDVATRANVAGVVAMALAAWLLGRLATEVLSDLRAPVTARRTNRELWHEPVSAGAGALVALTSLAVFLAMSAAGPVSLSIALIVAVWIRLVRIVRTPEGTRDGLWLSAWAGVTLAADPRVPAFVWPPSLLVWAWALRRGERWPLLAPMMAIAGATAVLYAAVVGEPTVGVARLLTDRLAESWRAVAPSTDAAAVVAGLLDVVSELGVVASLVALVGVFVLATRVPFVAALVLASAALGLLLAAAGARPVAGDPAGLPLAAVIAASALPVAVGIAHLAAKLGAARTAVAVVLAVTALVWPVMDGGARRWVRDDRVPGRLLEHALAGAGPRAVVKPGSAEISGLLRYGRALGLRPDVQLEP